jgi:hypothetical protein
MRYSRQNICAVAAGLYQLIMILMYLTSGYRLWLGLLLVEGKCAMQYLLPLAAVARQVLSLSALPSLWGAAKHPSEEYIHEKVT